MAAWTTLYIPRAEAEPVAAALRATLSARGYAPFDPFPGGTGTPPRLAATVRQWVAPAREGWVIVLGEPDADALNDFQARLGEPVILGWLAEDGGGFALLDGGARSADPAALVPYLRPGASEDALRAAFAGTQAAAPVVSGAHSTKAGGDALPPEIAQYAQQQGVDPRQANKLFDRVGGRLLGRLGGGADRAGAQALLGGAPDLWNSPHGARVQAIAALLALPETWRSPTWEQVRDAYQLQRLRQRSPRLPLMPGDAAALAAVPEAAHYLPVYLGRAAP